MYKCTECGTEYEIKPAYCECGNDEFDEINKNFIEDNQEKENHPQIKVKPPKIKKPKKTFYEQYPQIEKFVESLDILSVIFFTTCLILAILIWIFAWNFDTNNNKQDKETPTPIKTEIPLIDNIWDSTPPVAKTTTKEDDEVFIPVPKVEIVPKKQEIQRPVVKTINKIIKTTPKKQTTVKENKNIKNNTQKTKQETQTTKITNPVIKTEKPKVVTAPTPVSTPKTQNKTTTTNNRELQNYKAALRQTLFARLNIGSIEGDGECIISFSLSSTGKLVNRNFVRQSNNTSLNNAIYRMLMNTSTYSPPPTSYKGETLVLKFSYNNGYYEFGYQ